MNSFSILSNESILQIKKNQENFNQWKKLKYSLTSTVQRLVSTGHYSEAEYDEAREVLGRCDLGELLKLSDMVDLLKADTMLLSEWLELADNAKADHRSMIKVTKRSKPVKLVTVRAKLDPDAKKLKEEIAKTVRLIKSHVKKGEIDIDVGDERTEHVIGLDDCCDVVKYRNSIKLVRKPVVRRKKHVPLPEDDEDEASAEEELSAGSEESVDDNAHEGCKYIGPDKDTDESEESD